MATEHLEISCNDTLISRQSSLHCSDSQVGLWQTTKTKLEFKVCRKMLSVMHLFMKMSTSFEKTRC